MNSDNQQIIYCKDGEYRMYCKFCDKLCIECFYENHLKSQTHTNITHKENNKINHFK